jgi:hypothetical protein
MSLRDAVNRIEKRVQALESGDNNVWYR